MTDLNNLLDAINEIIYDKLYEVGGIISPVSQEKLRKLKILTEIVESNIDIGMYEE